MKRLHDPSKVSYYHCSSAVTHGMKWLDEESRSVFCSILHKVADFCGVGLVAYSVMDNHFQMLIRVPAANERKRVNDKELLRRFRVLYCDCVNCGQLPIAAKALEAVLKAGGEEAQEWRNVLRSRMHDLPMFMKLLKQRFSQWYNGTHKTYGAFWAQRYNNLLLGPYPEILRRLTLFIDLSPVRAGLVEHPKDYRWCGIAAALSGDEKLLQERRVLIEKGNSPNQVIADVEDLLSPKNSVPESPWNELDS